MKKQKEIPFLNAYSRKRNALLVKAISEQSPTSLEERIAQVERLKKQTDDNLKKNVVHTEPVKAPDGTGRNTVQWSVWSKAPESGFGHGIQYHDRERQLNDSLVAFIRGFSWRHSHSAIVQGYHIQPDAITTADVIAEMKQRVEQLVAEREMHVRGENTNITSRITTHGNC